MTIHIILMYSVAMKYCTYSSKVFETSITMPFNFLAIVFLDINNLTVIK